MLKALSGLYADAGRIWCKFMHPDPMWPVKGKYICPTCQRTYPVPWETDEVAPAARPELLPIRTSVSDHVAA